MPQFTPWNVPSPAPNVLYNPAAVDQAIADSQSKLGGLDIDRQKLGLERDKIAREQAAGDAWLKGGDGTAPTTAPADATQFELKMGNAEGGSDPTVVNKQGYAGQFQFGSERLADLGLYTPAPGEGRNGWKGQFHIAPYNVTTLDDFLKNPAAQHAAFVAHVADIDKTIDATPGADKFDRNGLRAVAHLGGVRGMQAFIQSGGNLNSADSNGTSLKNYYDRFAAGGPALLQKSFGSVHGPGGPPSDLPAVQPGGRVGTAWVDPNAPLPVPPIPPPGGPPPVRLAGPRAVQPGATDAASPGYPPQVSDANGIAVPTPTLMPDPGATPVQTSAADATVPVAPSPIALRTGGTDVAGPGAGPDALPPVDAPNRMYQTGLPGITIGANPLAPSAATGASPGTAPATVAPAPPAATPPGAATRPPVLQPPPAASRTIPLDPLIQSGPGKDLTPAQFKQAGLMISGGAPIAGVMAKVEEWRQQNLARRDQAQAAAAVQQQQDYQRQEDYRKAQIEAEKTAYQRQQDAETARRNAEADARAVESQRLAQGAAAREAAKAEREAELAKNPIQGTDLGAQHENTLLTIGPKIESKTATPDEERRYASAYYAAQQSGAQTVTITDPNNPNQTIPAMIPRRLPPAFPEPKGGALPQVVATPGAGKQDQMTMEQGKVAGFADRVRQALPVISDTSEAAMNRWQVMRGQAPLVGNSLISPEFQLHQQSERNFINAVLRRESGAAIQPEEFIQARLQYIPQPGDSPQLLAQKAQNRETVLAGMIREAGPGYKPGGADTAAPGGTPVSVKTPEEATALKPGTRYTTPDGKTFIR